MHALLYITGNQWIDIPQGQAANDTVFKKTVELYYGPENNLKLLSSESNPELDLIVSNSYIGSEKNLKFLSTESNPEMDSIVSLSYLGPANNLKLLSTDYNLELD